MSAELDINIELLHENAKQRHPRTLVKFSNVLSQMLEASFLKEGQKLNSVCSQILEKSNHTLHIEGEFNPCKTLIVGNHPSWFYDFVAVYAACPPLLVDNLKVISRDEIAISMPQPIRSHFIPVGIKTRLSVYQPQSRNLSSTDNSYALNLAAEHVMTGGNLIMFPQGTTDQKFNEGGNPKTWKRGIGVIANTILENQDSSGDVFVQPLKITVEGNTKIPLSINNRRISLTLGSPIQLQQISQTLNNNGVPINPDTLTAAMQEIQASVL